MGSWQASLSTAWAAAAASKDQVQQRSEKISSMLALLTASHQQPWFQAFVTDRILSTYPKPHRCLLDAVLQVFVAASPICCGPVLGGFLQIPGCLTLKSPFRRDLAALFKAPAQLHTCWEQQGTVGCSIVAYMAVHASQQLFQAQQQQRQQRRQQLGEQLGTAVGWLVDCLLHAIPQQQLPLMQLLLAVAVAECTKLERQQWQEGQLGDDDGSDPSLHPSKRRRLDQQQQQQQQQQQVTSHIAATPFASSTPSQQALQLGVQVLTAVCCCEIMQHGSRQLVPCAAAAAASAGSGDTAWLYRQLCLQVPASAQPNSSSAAGSGGAGSSATAAAGTTAQHDTTGLQPSAALAHVLRLLVCSSPARVLQFVHCIMGPQPPPTDLHGGSTTATAVPAAAAGAIRRQPSNTAAAAQAPVFQDMLLEAARQWRPLPGAVQAENGKRKGKNAGKQSKQQQQQQLQLPAPGTGAAAPALTLMQVMPAAPNVNATWVCKHIVPVLVQQSREEWAVAQKLQQQQETQQQQQQQRQQQEQLTAVRGIPGAAALVQLLLADGLLLPAAGEVVVSARLLAEGLEQLEPALQRCLVETWSDQLQEHQAATVLDAAPPQTAAAVLMRAPLVAWQQLQPMLCLLSTLDLQSPFADFLAACVRSCIASSTSDAAAAAVAGIAPASSGSAVRDILQHVLMPLRFGIKMPGRVWLLQQLLMLKQLPPVAEPHAAAGGDAAEVLQVLEQLVSTNWQKQLAQGLALLAKQQQHQLSVEADSDTSQGGSYSALSLQQAQGVDLATVLVKLVGVVEAEQRQQQHVPWACDAGQDSGAVGAGAAVGSEPGARAQEAAQRLCKMLTAADPVAYNALRARLPGDTPDL